MKNELSRALLDLQSSMNASFFCNYLCFVNVRSLHVYCSMPFFFFFLIFQGALLSHFLNSGSLLPNPDLYHPVICFFVIVEHSYGLHGTLTTSSVNSAVG